MKGVDRLLGMAMSSGISGPEGAPLNPAISMSEIVSKKMVLSLRAIPVRLVRRRGGARTRSPDGEAVSLTGPVVVIDHDRTRRF